jgi:hypothetical protein
MTPIHAILRDTAACLILAIGAGFWLGGAMGAVGVAATGGAVLLNLFVIGRLVPRLTAYMAGTDPGGVVAVGVLGLKFPVMLIAVTVLVTFFGGTPVALGMGALVVAIFVRGVALMLRPAPPAEPVAPQGS